MTYPLPRPNMSRADPVFMTEKEALNALGVLPADLTLFVETGHLQLFLDGRNRLFKRDQVQALKDNPDWSKLRPGMVPPATTVSRW